MLTDERRSEIMDMNGLVIAAKKFYADGVEVTGGASSVDWADIQGKPAFGDLATKDSVDYADVTGTPTLGALATKDTVAAAELASNAVTNVKVAAAAAIAATKIAVAADAASGVTAGDLQAAIVALATRVKALEDA